MYVCNLNTESFIISILVYSALYISKLPIPCLSFVNLKYLGAIDWAKPETNQL